MKSPYWLVSLTLFFAHSAWSYPPHPYQSWYDVNSESKRFLHEEAENTSTKRRGLEIAISDVGPRCAVPLVSSWVVDSKGKNTGSVKVSCAKSEGQTDKKEWSTIVATAPLEKIEILTVEKPDSVDGIDMTASECKEWQQGLTKQKIKYIFENSEKYPDSVLPYGDGYYFLPCSVEGELKRDGVNWYFSINAAATAVWSNDKNENIAWGCDARGCSKLFLLPYNAMGDTEFN